MRNNILLLISILRLFSSFKVAGMDIVNKRYVTPQMYGAAGDGVTDDTRALQAALDCAARIDLSGGQYSLHQP